jgi:hypothetical protein
MQKLQTIDGYYTCGDGTCWEERDNSLRIVGDATVQIYDEKKKTCHSQRVSSLVQGELKGVDGFPGYYLSTRGRLFRRNDGVMRPIASFYTKKQDYPVVRMYRDGKPYTRGLALLMLGTFFGPEYDGSSPNFKDGDTNNCTIENLKTGPSPRGKRSLRSFRKISQKERERLLSMDSRGVSLDVIAAKFDLPRSSVYQFLYRTRRRCESTVCTKPNPVFVAKLDNFTVYATPCSLQEA